MIRHSDESSCGAGAIGAQRTPPRLSASELGIGFCQQVNQFLSLMTFDEEHHRLGIVQLPQPAARNPDDGGASAFGLHLPQPGKPAHQVRGPEEGGHPSARARAAQPQTSLYYRDPDDNTVELQIDNFTTLEEATQYMRGEEFHADPFGPSFDPDAMLAAALRGGHPGIRTTHQSLGQDLPTAQRPGAAADMTQIERSGTTISHDSGATEPTTKRHAEQAGPSTTARSPRPPGLLGPVVGARTTRSQSDYYFCSKLAPLQHALLPANQCESC